MCQNNKDQQKVDSNWTVYWAAEHSWTVYWTDVAQTELFTGWLDSS